PSGAIRSGWVGASAHERLTARFRMVVEERAPALLAARERVARIVAEAILIVGEDRRCKACFRRLAVRRGRHDDRGEDDRACGDWPHATLLRCASLCGS